jgi:hypothetical protein
MTERTENGRTTRLQIEVFFDSNTGGYFIDVTDPTDRLNTPYTIGAFLSLDDSLRYVYTTLDEPTGMIEVVDVSKEDITFSLDMDRINNMQEALDLIGPNSEKNNVIDIRSKRDKDK